MTTKIYKGNCPVIDALTIIGGKWKLPLLWHLANNQSGIRYNALKRKLDGITNIMLTRSLRELEEDGLVTRVQYPEIPPHVNYSLTEQGEKLIPALLTIKEWGEQLQESKNDWGKKASSHS
ncbi:helix-turn-helix transcriptional regulator [Sporolactobacillus shoreicorticis]|uniref:Winged helix-turn-helix transcriptional regulator n=1 Tax=Sporolactobacillus shoreicorticis TaxID=1923877 RepID=A0ABW5S0E6_9BACL|nr:helix-turn-helix domain-containing protein [Sporolactobacillus shoreicorticis]MCO7124623.1 helix-turn-helix transcriptional regulator [Sporolactobacillus shoreicorticis]